MHNLLLYDFNLCYNLMKKPLLERAMANKKFVRQFQILQNKINNSKNSDIKNFKRPKTIKESDDSLLRNYIYIYVGSQIVAQAHKS